MLYRRLLAGFLVLGVLTVQAVPTSGQEEEKKDKKEEKDKKEKKKDDETDEKGALAWKFEVDKPFYQKMTTKTKQTMTVMTNRVEQTQEQTFYFSWTPKSKEGDVWKIEQKIIG